jgi:hypothetical protein
MTTYRLYSLQRPPTATAQQFRKKNSGDPKIHPSSQRSPSSRYETQNHQTPERGEEFQMKVRKNNHIYPGTCRLKHAKFDTMFQLASDTNHHQKTNIQQQNKKIVSYP